MNALFLCNIATHLWLEELHYLSLGQALKFSKNSLRLKEYYQKCVTKDNFIDEEIVQGGINAVREDYQESEYDCYENPELSDGIYYKNKLLINDFKEYIISNLVIRKNKKELEDLINGEDEEIERMIEMIDGGLSYNLDCSAPTIKDDELLEIRKMISDAIKYRAIYEGVATGDKVVLDLINRDFGTDEYMNFIRIGEENYICPNCGTNEIRRSHEYCCKCGKKIHWNKNTGYGNRKNYNENKQNEIFYDEFLEQDDLYEEDLTDD